MVMGPRIENLAEKRLIGKRIRTTLSDDNTFELWHSFMPERKLILNRISADLFSIQVYDKSLVFKNFNQETEFEKWAAMEVADFDAVPDGMEPFTLAKGQYAVFIHKGGPDTFPGTLNFIFGNWLPGSDWVLDHRPHFEILGEQFKLDDPDSEEEVWIPVKPKK
jgi:AraC family transcriptional regulator